MYFPLRASTHFQSTYSPAHQRISKRLRLLWCPIFLRNPTTQPTTVLVPPLPYRNTYSFLHHTQAIYGNHRKPQVSTSELVKPTPGPTELYWQRPGLPTKYQPALTKTVQFPQPLKTAPPDLVPFIYLASLPMQSFPDNNPPTVTVRVFFTLPSNHAVH